MSIPNNSGERRRRMPPIGRRFAKVSGNPHGRPKLTPDMRALFQAYTDDELDGLAKALNKPRDRVAAAAAILAYSWGRPQSAVDIAAVDAADNHHFSRTRRKHVHAAA